MKLSEATLYAHLTNPDSLDVLAREGFSHPDVLEVIPTELGRRLVAWCLDRYFESGRLVAPSKDAIMETWGEAMERVDIAVEDETEPDSVQWAIGELRSHLVYVETEKFTKVLATEVYEADAPDRPTILARHATELVRLARQVGSRRSEMEGLEGTDDAIHRFKQRVADGNSIFGLRFGWPEFDQHTLGIRPGEICTIAGGPAIGKSWTAGYLTNQEMFHNRRALLVTLENDVESAYDRLVCMGAHVRYERWQQGSINEAERSEMDRFRELMAASEHRPVVTQMGDLMPTPSILVRRAQLEGADSLLVDQMSHVRAEPGSRTSKRAEQLAEIMRDFKTLLREEYSIPLVLFNQINREGRTAVRKSGWFEMEHLSDGSAVEQGSDHVYAIFQNELMRREQIAQIQQLKARRTVYRHFEMTWRPEVGDIRVQREITRSQS